MAERTTQAFWEQFGRLPKEIQATAVKQFRLFVDNPAHPSLAYKRVGAFWSVRVNDSYRALAHRKGNDIVFFWIGTHDHYERLIERLTSAR